MGKNPDQLRVDVKWWEDEVRAREGKVKEAERTLEQRRSELVNAERDEEREKREEASKRSQSSPKRY